MKRIKGFRLLLLIAGLCFVLSTHAQQTPEKFIQETNYLLSLPEGYNSDTTKQWPLLIFLHGSGERGADLAKVKAHGPPQLADQGKKFPFIVVSPQAPLGEGWSPENLYRLLKHIRQTQRVDNKRVYLTGLSMGGFGTWAMAMKYPEEFAAIAPVCGGGDTADAWKLRHIAIWNFHGAKDDVVLPVESERMVKAARRYNPSVKFTLYPYANHNSWDSTYSSNDSLYEWLLAQTKFSYKEVPVSAVLLKQYAGKYVGPDKDTLQFEVVRDTLVVKRGREVISLKYAGNDLFFIQPGASVDLTFIREKGIVRSFLLMANKRVLYRKILVK